MIPRLVFSPIGGRIYVLRCRACGWWPPLVRVRNLVTCRASDAWRWRQLFVGEPGPRRAVARGQ